MTGPLAGIRVVELTTAWAGPMAGRILAFLGAEVIHVEAPTRVNSWRLNKEARNPVNFPDRVAGARFFDRAFLFNSQNVNKRSLILDLKAAGGTAALLRLLAVSDVLLCNFRPGLLARLGLGYETLRAQKPDIIVAEMPAFGTAAPMAGYAALGPTMEMAAGMSSLVGYPDGAPTTTGPSYSDPIGGFNAAAAILTALHHRQATGEGQVVEIPQVEAAMQFIGEELLWSFAHGADRARDGNHVPDAAPHDAYAAQGEDEWVAIAVGSDAEFAALCATIGEAGLAADLRFAAFAARRTNQDELRAPIERWTAARDKHDAARLLQAAGVPAAPVCNARDVAESDYLAARGFFTVLTHPDAGIHKHPGLPIRLSRTPGAQRRAAPCFGADNHAVLAEIGLTPDEIRALEASGALASVPLEGA
jgi:crotonobetainyl-CoA:carnitine CoA-transferase CaiB-like acyl-CoA transferase